MTHPCVYNAAAVRISDGHMQQHLAIYKYIMVQTREGAQPNEWWALLNVVGAAYRICKALQQRQKDEPWTEARPIGVTQWVRFAMSNTCVCNQDRPNI